MAETTLDDYIKTNQITRSGSRANATSGVRTSGRQFRGVRSPHQQAGNPYRTAQISGGIRKNNQRHSWGGSGQFARPRRYTHNQFAARSIEGPGSRAGTKIIISNLFYGVSESDIGDLFSELGPVLKLTMNFDSSGRSLGTAEIVYQRAGDALAAIEKYNGVSLDGKPMEIELVGGRNYVNTFPRRRSFGAEGSPAVAWSNSHAGYNTHGVRAFTAGVGGAVGRRGGARGVGPARTVKPEVTLEQLNMELDEFVLR